MEEALKVAIDLLHVPSRLRHVRLDRLPLKMITVLRIAAGEEEAIAHATAALDRPRRVLEDAASFFIEQVLFDPDADSYRVLGAESQASTTDLRRNMALLLRWVHPDLDKNGARASFAVRVSRAWDDLKTPERRDAYDLRNSARIRDAKAKAARSTIKTGTGSSGGQKPAMRSIKPGGKPGAVNGHRPGQQPGRNSEIGKTERGGFLRRTLSFLFTRN